MAWEDRPYYRDRSGAMNHPLVAMMNGSLPLFTAFGIRVRAHAWLIIFILGDILFGGILGGPTLFTRLTYLGFLFFIVVLHEFGHCFAARSVGGGAEEILLTPLGGLAMAESPRRPWARFVTVAGGPLVNVGLCLVAMVAVYFLTPTALQRHYVPSSGHLVVSLNPFELLPPAVKTGSFFVSLTWKDPAFYFWWLFMMSYVLLLFNLLPIFPLDGGRLLQSILWPRMGYHRSIMSATMVGMVGAVILAGVGLIKLNFLLIFIAIWCFLECRRERMMLREIGGDESGDHVDYSASLFPPDEEQTTKRKRLSRRAIARARKIVQQEIAMRNRLDTILAKVSSKGFPSLTWRERRELRRATARQKQRAEEISNLNE